MNVQHKGATIKWHLPPLWRKLKKELRKRANRVGVKLVNQIQENISVSTRDHGPSKPGEYPHLDTGALRASIFHRLVDQGVAWQILVGSPLPYAVFLEYNGRSFLRRTLHEMWHEVLTDLTAPVSLVR